MSKCGAFSRLFLNVKLHVLWLWFGMHYQDTCMLGTCEVAFTNKVTLDFHELVSLLHVLTSILLIQMFAFVSFLSEHGAHIRRNSLVAIFLCVHI